MHITFMVAEKPSLAQSIAKSLSRNQFSTRKGFNGACSVHEWNGSLNIRGRPVQVKFKMTSVCGHVFGLNFHSKYNNWDKTDPFELFSAGTITQEANPKLRMVEFLQKEARGSSSVVLWLDCDKEGENICFEVLDSISQHIEPQSEIFRARFSAITDEEIWRAFNNLSKPNKNEAMSVDARQELDLRIGCAFTRYQTKFFQDKYGDLDSKLISFGPCQTPTLGFCVERYDRIQSFKPEAHWSLRVQVYPRGLEGAPIDLEWSRGRLFDKSVCNMFFNVVKGETKATVQSITVKTASRAKPIALKTVDMLRVASSGLGIGAHACMNVAERLYTQGYISYPRTETTSYPDSFDLKGPLLAQRNNSEWGELVEQILTQGISRPKKGADAGDHPPITPMKGIKPGELSGDALKLYNYITQHYIATLLPDCKMEVKKMILEIGKDKPEEFSFTTRRILQAGWLAAMPWLTNEGDESPNNGGNNLPPLLDSGDKLNLAAGSPWMQEGHTGPPDFLTESDLIGKMEKHGIGTDASIPVHVQNIIERNYVQIISGRKLQPTKLGIVLVHGYQQIDPELVLPHMRSAVEQQLDLIAKGQANFDEVLRHTIAVFSAKFKYFVEKISTMNELFEDSFTSLSETGKPLTRCGKCNRVMKLITSTPQRLHCNNCSTTYPLPSGMAFVRQYKAIRCPLDNFELVAVGTGGPKGKSYCLCPYCYSNPPFEDMARNIGCNKCTHPSCPQSQAKLAVTACHECSNGLLLLDDCTAPRFKLSCNVCPVLIMMESSIVTVSLTSKSCEFCNAVLMEVKLNSKGAGDNPSEFSGCLFCDEKMSSLLQLEHVDMRRGGGRGNRSRGRSAGGRRSGGRRGRR